ncbi:MAG TPA: Smr/MutS family protein [Rudaea sp.]|jgi:DNA-nicking Smr family endonuclease|nr:Smr/MutS family protein [Rudaea sp.]
MAKRRDIPVSAEDRRLFEEAVGPVRRLEHEHAEHGRARPAPEPVQSLLDEARVPQELLRSAIDPAEMEVGEELSYLKSGLSPRLLRQLKRGHFSIADEIDLHQMGAEVARAAVKEFLEENKRAGRLCIKIIHGKGLRSSAQGPVLKRLVDGMLRRRADVLAFASAKPAEGGTGAVIVLLAQD